jgi:hypothetical protein
MKTFGIHATSSLYWQGEGGEESIPIAFTISKLPSPFLQKIHYHIEKFSTQQITTSVLASKMDFRLSLKRANSSNMDGDNYR